MSKPGTEECFPFDEHTLVFKVIGKMFALTNLRWESFSVNLKCDPERAEELRSEYDEITPGYHMSKKHWNTIEMEGQISNSLAIELIDHSYDLVVKSLTKAKKALLNE
ncbi:MmcQ/YjbR family DNA-binding protein [Saprospiraceae bacterium]|nr:MmcQ/YjbR family DNA-binding protein [Saprospiraceae bacterium]